MNTQIAKVAAGVALTFGALIGGVATVGAQESGPASVTVHQRICGEDYQGGNPFDECHDVLLDQAFEFTIDGPVTATDSTDAATGNVTFEDLPAGTYELYGGVPGHYSEKEVYCTDIGTGGALIVTETDMGVQFAVPAGAEVVCDIYEHPIDQRGEVPAEEENGPVTALPNTGAGIPSTTTGGLGLLLVALGAGASGVALRRRELFS